MVGPAFIQLTRAKLKRPHQKLNRKKESASARIAADSHGTHIKLEKRERKFVLIKFMDRILVVGGGDCDGAMAKAILG